MKRYKMGCQMDITAYRGLTRRVLFGAGLCAFAGIFVANAARAEPVKILALGASNTNGRGVGTSAAWPAQLERMLRARGYDATVHVNAINGDTSAGVLSRASEIPAGTRVVVFDTGGDNDLKRGMSQAEVDANKSRIIAVIRSRGAKAIVAPYKKVIGPMRSGGAGYQADGHHLTAQSHQRIAAYLLPSVVAAIKRNSH